MRIYIAGPMRGYPNFNFPAFDLASALGRSYGHEIISPAEIDRKAGVSEQNAPTTFDAQGHQTGEKPAGYAGPVIDEDFMRHAAARDFDAIVGVLNPATGKYEGGCDAVAVLPGWEKSKGANGEKGLADWIGLKVLDARTFRPLGEPEPEGVCYTCGEGACPSMADIVKQQAEHLANTP